ncbi:hypothetical protein XELAEV_18009062mg [Xenopus laevis]|uniref:Uncharacterized protein n=1 Tax=Xenopus laevis TaxID=8355 RepID=A0A974I0H4_XENLA|nr:hypothetical protein XELAEV_18009062mg [Xenopus laevis]
MLGSTYNRSRGLQDTIRTIISLNELQTIPPSTGHIWKRGGGSKLDPAHNVFHKPTLASPPLLCGNIFSPP